MVQNWSCYHGKDERYLLCPVQELCCVGSAGNNIIINLWKGSVSRAFFLFFSWIKPTLAMNCFYNCCISKEICVCKVGSIIIMCISCLKTFQIKQYQYSLNMKRDQWKNPAKFAKHRKFQHRSRKITGLGTNNVYKIFDSTSKTVWIIGSSSDLDIACICTVFPILIFYGSGYRTALDPDSESGSWIQELLNNTSI